jgi:NAD(P)-dependent dehydrogenase (short-subunit alcohol dehydrogenase family)
VPLRVVVVRAAGIHWRRMRGSVVITGASTGIGRATALLLDREGFRVFAGVRKETDGELLRKEASDRLTTLALDVIAPEQIRAAAERVAREVGDAGIQGLFNNAGIGVGGPLEFFDLDELRLQLEVNTVGTLAVTQAFLPLIRKGRGRILNGSSMGGILAAPYTGPYSASKFAIEALSDSLRMELRPWKIDVIVIEPGAVDTPLFAKSHTNISDVLDKLPPHGRELYGPDAKMMHSGIDLIASRILPDRWLDALRARLMGLRRAA